MTERIRTTISLDPQVHAIFVKMSEASGVSVSRCMGDWLADTAEGAQFVANKMIEARAAPRTVMREFQAMAKGLSAEVDAQLLAIRQGARGDIGGPARQRPRRADGGAAPPSPPSSNTGGKVPQENPRPKGGKGS